jgi:hypothetical protein
MIPGGSGEGSTLFDIVQRHPTMLLYTTFSSVALPPKKILLQEDIDRGRRIGETSSIIACADETFF